MLKGIIDTIKEFYPLLFKAYGITLLLAAVTVFFGAIIGFFVCILTMSKSIVLRFIGKTYVEVIRGVPLLLQLILIFALMPRSTNKSLSFITAAIALIINSGAYVAEIIRAGIQGVNKGQTEAARSLGLSKTQTMIKVVFPQAIKNILPAIGNEYVAIIKETSLGLTFFVGELMTAQKYISNQNYKYLESLIVVALFYFVTTFTLSKLIGRVERRLRESD
jgi:polar amino acid transport system permease protein/polar amino acid transport system substrate-binding protein